MSLTNTHLPRNSLQPVPQGHLDWVGSSIGLALDRIPQAELSTTMSVLDQEVHSRGFQLQSHTQGDASRALALNNFANALFARFELSGMIPDLDDAIGYHREVLSLSQDYGDQSASLNNLAYCLYARFKRLGMLSDLREAIGLHQKVLELRQPGHRDRPTTLNNLALCLSSLFDQQGVESDIDEAINLLRDARSLLQIDDPNLSFVSLNLGDCFYTRFKHTMHMDYLLEAIDFHRQAFRQQDGAAQPYASSSLARSLFTRFEASGDTADLQTAIDLNRGTIPRCLRGHSIRPKLLHNLGECLFARFNLFGELSDLDAAIECHREVLDLRPLGHPDRSSTLSSLAKCFLIRSKHSRRFERTDRREAFKLYLELRDVSQTVHAVFLQDVYAARDWVCAAEETRHPTTISAYQTLFKLLINHLATLPSLTQHFSILKRLTSSLAMDAFSACLRHDSPADALELLEQGRAVFLGLLSRLRSPLDEVVTFGERGKQLAEKFKELALLVRNALNSPCADQHERVHRLNVEMQRVITDIRELPGLSRFLLPSLFSDLQCATSEGPIIIVNASQYSCDALIVLLDQDPVHIPLQITQENVRDLSTELHTLTVRAKRADVTRELAMFLRKLWDQIVSPIIDFLQTTHRSQSRIWWCPTAEFSGLPLHVAGPYMKNHRNIHDLYISSYTSTLTALIRARRCDPSNSAAQRKCFVAIGQASAIGQSQLPSVCTELDNISQRVDGLATFTRIDGEESCISRVVEELGRNEWVHLACHGIPNRIQPFESAFALRDGRFTIQQIIGCDLKNPEFAYLSACHTTVGDEESPDEVIHLASAMQFAGFRSVIGTMWAVDDGETSKITSTFYKHMVDESGRLDHTRAAFALNKTMKSVRIPLDQRILYIHIGA